jgi:hypothetical protein
MRGAPAEMGGRQPHDIARRNRYIRTMTAKKPSA